MGDKSLVGDKFSLLHQYLNLASTTDLYVMKYMFQNGQIAKCEDCSYSESGTDQGLRGVRN
jgi:hypothetical protein